MVGVGLKYSQSIEVVELKPSYYLLRNETRDAELVRMPLITYYTKVHVLNCDRTSLTRLTSTITVFSYNGTGIDQPIHYLSVL